MSETDVTKIAEDILHEESKHREALAVLLDKYLAKSDKILVERIQMGGTQSYIGSVSLSWFATKVRFAQQLPLFAKRLDSETGQLIIDKETIGEVQQRPLDWSRQAALSLYLAVTKNHKFPPILAVVTRDWVDNLDADEWDTDNTALVSPADFDPLDHSGRVGLLDLSDKVNVYALDGQHRLMGAKGIMEIINGRLQRLKKDGRPVKITAPITPDYLTDVYQVEGSELQSRSQELIGIEFISAVMPGETREQAKRRVRSIYVHVNTKAVPLSKSQLDQLDEDDGFAIVGRKTYLKSDFLVDRTELDKGNLGDKDQAFTTLHTIVDMAFNYLGLDNKLNHWKRVEKDVVPLRPPEEELDEATNRMVELMDVIESMPHVLPVTQGGDISEARKFESLGHLMFRPIGQMALAEAFGALIYGDKKLELGGLRQKLHKYDEQDGFSHINEPSSLWYGVLADVTGVKMKGSGRPLAVDLLKYLFGGGIADDRERDNLRKSLAEARTVDDRTRDFDGKWVESEKIVLPPVM